ncbi:MAG: alanine:cation symporter family protein [Treponema sp.]|nr:alanine:cation symporter family protein [Treponema sp.]
MISIISNINNAMNTFIWGAIGYGFNRAVSWGFRRGAFSNEAGLGSSVMIHASSNVKEPAQQGMWGILEVRSSAKSQKIIWTGNW